MNKYLKMITMENKEIIRKKFGTFFIVFYVITFLMFFIFPKQLVGNFYVIIAYFVGCLVFLSILYKFKQSLNKKNS